MKYKEHNYPSNIKIIDNPFLETLLAKASTPQCTQPEFTGLIKTIYSQMYGQIFANLELEDHKVDTRMDSTLSYKRVKPNKAVVVDMARAGMIPSQVLYELLHSIFLFKDIRQDHIYISRTTDESEKVTGASIASSKIGGSIDQSYVFIPDPMGATGSSVCDVLKDYKELVNGSAKRYICIHLIITPEYIKKISSLHPDIEVYALRLDRGLSTKMALDSIPGKYPDQEKGLNDKQYIIPGAGGIGEILNNSFV